MLIVSSIVGLIALVIGIVLYLKEYDWEETGVAIAWCGGIVLVVSLVAMAFVGANVATAHTIDEKITLYEQENRVIEEKVELSVSTYLEYEQETLTSLTPENAGNFLFLYPELSADTMIKEQIATYQANYRAIVQLKVDKINVSKLKWWLYFGS